MASMLPQSGDPRCSFCVRHLQCDFRPLLPFVCRSRHPRFLVQECPEVPPMECAEGDQVCPTGADDNGCAYPDVCMPAGADCPVVCAPTPPPMCGDDDVLCFMGEDDNGCLLPYTCMPAGEPCPVVCPRTPPMECA